MFGLSLTHTYVGRVGSSMYFSRTDFYADDAAHYIPSMFQVFDDRLATAFTKTLRESHALKHRVRTPSKLRRLRSLGNVVSERISETFEDAELVAALVDESREEEFFAMIGG